MEPMRWLVRGVLGCAMLAPSCSWSETRSIPWPERGEGTGVAGNGSFWPDGAAFPVLSIDHPQGSSCDFERLSTADIARVVGSNVRFTGLVPGAMFYGMVTGDTFRAFVGTVESTGEDFAVWFDVEGTSASTFLTRLAPVDRSFSLLDAAGTTFLACGATSCALFDIDPASTSTFRRISSGTVPRPGIWSNLIARGTDVCVEGGALEALCFDGTAWRTPAGGSVVSSLHRVDAGTDDAGGLHGGVARDAGANDAGVPDAATLRARPLVDAGPLEVRLSVDAGESPRCDSPVTCGDATLADDPICLSSESTGYGVTRSGRFIRVGHLTGQAAPMCSIESAPFGPPLAALTSYCGISTNLVVLTTQGLYATCDCFID